MPTNEPATQEPRDPADAQDERPPSCEVGGAPARERDCGGWDDHCSDRCALEAMARLLGRAGGRP